MTFAHLTELILIGSILYSYVLPGESFLGCTRQVWLRKLLHYSPHMVAVLSHNNCAVTNIFFLPPLPGVIFKSKDYTVGADRDSITVQTKLPISCLVIDSLRKHWFMAILNDTFDMLPFTLKLKHLQISHVYIY